MAIITKTHHLSLFPDEFELEQLKKPKPANDGKQLNEIKPLNIESLKYLYDLTDWRVIPLEEVIAREYGEEKIPTLSIFKALTLPYLINIPTERALGRELKEKEQLQLICGFLPGQKIPSRETIWHFRHKYSDVYPEIMLKILIAMVLSGKSPNLNLPFVTQITEHEMPQNREYQLLKIDEYRPEIEVWRVVDDNDEDIASNAASNDVAENGCLQSSELLRSVNGSEEGSSQLNQLSKEQKEYKHQKSNHQKVGLVGGLGLPVEVKTKLYNGHIVHFWIDEPPWLNVKNKVMDPLTGIRSNNKTTYTACNILVIKEENGHSQLLLSKRKDGYGSGQFTLPGGKQQQGESLQECAKRELWEETGLRLVKAKPVSLKITRFPGKPLVISVGVCAEAYIGDPKNKEESQHTEWEWYDFDQLPSPLFEPARIVISHFRNRTFPNLQWDDIEDQQAKQMSLFEENNSKRH
jgi:8-oxo-dGTP diphosphatase